jgi:hypothetical protein
MVMDLEVLDIWGFQPAKLAGAELMRLVAAQPAAAGSRCSSSSDVLLPRAQHTAADSGMDRSAAAGHAAQRTPLAAALRGAKCALVLGGKKAAAKVMGAFSGILKCGKATPPTAAAAASVTAAAVGVDHVVVGAQQPPMVEVADASLDDVVAKAAGAAKADDMAAASIAIAVKTACPKRVQGMDAAVSGSDVEGMGDEGPLDVGPLVLVVQCGLPVQKQRRPGSRVLRLLHLCTGGLAVREPPTCG